MFFMRRKFYVMYQLECKQCDGSGVSYRCGNVTIGERIKEPVICSHCTGIGWIWDHFPLEDAMRELSSAGEMLL